MFPSGAVETFHHLQEGTGDLNTRAVDVTGLQNFNLVKLDPEPTEQQPPFLTLSSIFPPLGWI